MFRGLLRSRVQNLASKRFGSTSTSTSTSTSKFPGSTHHELEEFATAESASNRWKLTSFYVAIPGIFLSMYVAKQVLDAEHDHPAPAAYPYLNIATKLFPWGRGEESLFWNPHANVNPAKEHEEEPHYLTGLKAFFYTRIKSPETIQQERDERLQKLHESADQWKLYFNATLGNKLPEPSETNHGH